jgi:hypothetical protein
MCGFEAGELVHNREPFEVREAVRKPLKVIAEGPQSSRSPLFVRFLKGAPQVILDKSASDNIDVHRQHSSPLCSIPDSKLFDRIWEVIFA